MNRNLAFLSGVTVTFVALAAVVAGWGIYSLNNAFESLHRHEISTKLETINIARDVNYVSRLTRDIMLGADYEEDMEELEETAADIDNSFEVLNRAAHDAGDRKLVEQARRDTMAFVDNCIQRMERISAIPPSQRNRAFAA